MPDVINYLGNNYATTAARSPQSVNDAASMGQLAGVDVKATAAIAASMQAMGVSTDRVGHQYQAHLYQHHKGQHGHSRPGSGI
ncbi:MAG: phage tail tape measure protein [Oscillospiraceae bacterium]